MKSKITRELGTTATSEEYCSSNVRRLGTKVEKHSNRKMNKQHVHIVTSGIDYYPVS